MIIPTIRSGATCRISTRTEVFAEIVFEYVHAEDDGSLTLVFTIGDRRQGFPLDSIVAIRATKESPLVEAELHGLFGR